MRKITLMAILVATTLTHAQVFYPVRNIKAEGAKRNSLILQTSRFNWDVPGVSSSGMGFLLGGDFALGKNVNAGFWFSGDSQRVNGVPVDLTWAELHFTWLFQQNQKSTMGLMLGGLAVDIKDIDTASWTELGIVGSVQLDAAPGKISRWGLGYNLGRLFGRETTSGQFKTADGLYYGLNLSHSFDDHWSAIGSWWVMDLDGAATAIRRLNFGIGYRF